MPAILHPTGPDQWFGRLFCTNLHRITPRQDVVGTRLLGTSLHAVTSALVGVALCVLSCW